MRSATTVFGGRVTDRPLVSMVIIGICVVVWVAQTAVADLTYDLWFVPVAGDTEPWRFLTSAFAHAPGNVMHILFNMLALWLVGGQYLEPLLGRARYAALYLLSAVGGSVGYLLLSYPPSAMDLAMRQDPGHWYTGAVGASGAVFGLFGALLVLNRKLGRSSAGMYATIVINAVLGFVIPNVAWQAHLGGLVTGAAAAAVIAATSSRERRAWQWPGPGPGGRGAGGGLGCQVRPDVGGRRLSDAPGPTSLSGPAPASSDVLHRCHSIPSWGEPCG